MGLWVESDRNPRYITDRTHPIIRREYEKRVKELGLRYGEEMTVRQRRDFDRDMVERYSRAFPVPGYAVWLLRIWEFLPAEDGS